MARILMFVMLGLAAIVVAMRFLPGGDAHKTPPVVVRADPLAPAPQPSMEAASTTDGSIAPATVTATAADPQEETTAPAAPTGPRVSLPDGFRGEWNANRAQCGSGRGETRLVIGPDWVRFHESDGTVTAVRKQNDRIVTIAAAFTGEGQQFARTIRMELSPSGQDLTIEGLVRHRCPEDAAKPAPRP